MKVILLVTVSKDKDVFYLLLRYKLKLMFCNGIYSTKLGLTFKNTDRVHSFFDLVVKLFILLP